MRTEAQRVNRDLENSIRRAKEILAQLLEIRPQVFYRDRIQKALNALEGK